MKNNYKSKMTSKYTIVTYVVASLLGISYFNIQGSNVELIADKGKKDYIEFLSKHGKSYPTVDEFKFRMLIFQKNKKFIDKHKPKNEDDVHLSINKFADWTEDELKKISGL
jgi:hypothetical protein